MRFLRQSIIGLFLASLTLGLLVYAGQIVVSAVQTRLSEESPSPPAQERVFIVNVVTAHAGTETPVLETFGEIAARRTLELRAAVSGRVVALAPNFENGARVDAGDMLAQIDPSELKAEVGRLSADLADAEAEVREAGRGLDLAQQDEEAARQQAALRQQAFARQRDLADRGVGTMALVEDAELAAAAAEAVVITRRLALIEAEARIDRAATQLDRARIALAEAQRDLEDTTIRAPFDGTLAATALVEGGLVAVNEKLADLIDPSDLEVAFRISTAQYARLLDADGALLSAPVTAVLDSADSDLVATGAISRVDAGAGDGQNGRVIFAQLDAARGFRPGDFVTVRVAEPAVKDVVRLPASAFRASGDVLVLGEDGRLERIEVSLVRRQGDDVLVRGEGLSGREVVRRLTPLLGEGIAVRPVRPKAEEASAAPVLELSEERRARLIALVENDQEMSQETKELILAQLTEREVSRQVVDRLEQRNDG